MELAQTFNAFKIINGTFPYVPTRLNNIAFAKKFLCLEVWRNLEIRIFLFQGGQFFVKERTKNDVLYTQ